MNDCLTTYASPVGLLTLAADEKGLVGLWIEGQKYHGGIAKSNPTAGARKNAPPLFDLARRWLDRYFAGEKPHISEISLSPPGSAFRQGVWEILCDIPYGECITYGEIARKMAAKLNRPSMSAQAIGGAVGHNPISIVIPCHRVVGANGSLTGYAGGIGTKIKLLKLEGADTSRLFAPTKGTAL